MARIKEIKARKILNSKGNPTIETTVFLSNNIKGVASVPSGTSVGKYEAWEEKDINKAIKNIETIVTPRLSGLEVNNQKEIDKIMIDIDGTKNKQKLGANSILSVSIAVAKTASQNLSVPLFEYLSNLTQKKQSKLKIPTPCFNLINGGKHGCDNLDLQEFLVIPRSSMSFKSQLKICSNVYSSLEKLLKDHHLTTQMGDEGGFSPNFQTNKEALSFLKQSVEAASLKQGLDIFLGLDCAASNFYKNGKYFIKDIRYPLSSSELVSYYNDLSSDFSLLYLEDPLAENDWNGWTDLTSKIPKVSLIAGDDLTTTNPLKLKKAFEINAITAIIIKPNQIGTVTEALEVVEIARKKGLKIIVSHRSGETKDDFIADFAVAVVADYVKFGALVQKERIAKYNRLLQIESQL